MSRDGPWVNTVVADSGAGIPPSKRELVFEPYESAHNPGTETGSVGLGLYVSRALARAMNGELSYSHDGSWSNFELRLPATGTEPSQPDAPATSMAHTRH